MSTESMIEDFQMNLAVLEETTPVDDIGSFLQVLAEIEGIVPPLWPLDDYVAVNPFVGLSDQPFLEAQQLLKSVRDCDLLMPMEYFRMHVKEGQISRDDISAAYSQCAKEYPDLYAEFSLADLLRSIETSKPPIASASQRFKTVAEAVDERSGSTWTSHIINDISRHCGALFDEGQAIWSSPWKGQPLYEAWHEAAQRGRRMDLLGLKGFHEIVAQLPANALDAIPIMLSRLNIPRTCWRQFLLCELYSVSGWASFVKYRVRQAEFSGKRNEDLIGLMAVRLAYDVALIQTPGVPKSLDLCPADAQFADGPVSLPPAVESLTRYAMLVASESRYRRTLCKSLEANAQADAPTIPSTNRKTLQIVFCIDVRSEVMRRHLESVSPAIETFGFAGFFGLALEYIPLGGTAGTDQCPVLLSPGFRIKESLLGADDSTVTSACAHRKTVRNRRKLWKSFQTSATSCFAFVESLGLAYAFKLVTDSLRLTRPVSSAERDGLPANSEWQIGPKLQVQEDSGLANARQIDLAEGILRNLGLTKDFARIVCLCGHASDVANNPYKAGLDCGACGGHSGEPNARVAAALLNEPAVRLGLVERGIQIPDDTWFVAAVHNTTTDEIKLCDLFAIPKTHAADLGQIQKWIGEAGRISRNERCRRLEGSDALDLVRRSQDWSEVRPEWGLAGNAAFIVAPRRRSQGLDLGGRTFLHSYDFQKDPDFKVLELIMTAPMVVTNWINLQYYASTVDNRAFGSGNKVIHNVVGQFGVLEGNGGDLMTGLPWQSVHDGKAFQHEPLRLLVVIEAPRTAVELIINKHENVRNLVTNGWLTLVVFDDHQFRRWTSQGVWEIEA